MMIGVLMGAVLLILCVKIFCCKKSGTIDESDTPREDNDGTDKRSVRIRPSPHRNEEVVGRRTHTTEIEFSTLNQNDDVGVVDEDDELT